MEFRRALGNATRILIAGTSTASDFDSKSRADSPILDGAMDVCSKYSFLIRARPRNPREIWGVFRGPRRAFWPAEVRADEWGR